jgi:hypothetical protein
MCELVSLLASLFLVVIAIEDQSSEDNLVVLVPNKIYSSHIGNRTVYQLRNDLPKLRKFSIFVVTLTAAFDSSAEILIQV